MVGSNPASGKRVQLKRCPSNWMLLSVLLATFAVHHIFKRMPPSATIRPSQPPIPTPHTAHPAPSSAAESLKRIARPRDTAAVVPAAEADRWGTQQEAGAKKVRTNVERGAEEEEKMCKSHRQCPKAMFCDGGGGACAPCSRCTEAPLKGGACPAKCKGAVRVDAAALVAVAEGPVTGSWPYEEQHGLWQEVVNGTCALDWAGVIKKETSQWQQSGISQTQVDNFCVKHTVRGSYVNGELRLSRFALDPKNLHRVRCGFWLIELALKRAIARGTPIPDFEINVHPGDASFGSQSVSFWANAGPVISNVKCGDASVSFPLTLHDMFGDGSGAMSLPMYKAKYAQAMDWSYHASQDYPQTWKARKDMAIFSAGGGATTRGNRSKIFKQAKGNEDVILALDRGKRMWDMGTYRYNIYAYGHCGWSRRVKELAMLDTVVLMEDSACREYVHGMFEPGVDFLPVKEDFSNLASVARKAKANAGESGQMASSWRKKGREMMSLGCTLDYTEGLLLELARLQTFKPAYHPEWTLHTIDRKRDWYVDGVYERHKSQCKKPKFRDSDFIFAKKHKC